MRYPCTVLVAVDALVERAVVEDHVLARRVAELQHVLSRGWA